MPTPRARLSFPSLVAGVRLRNKEAIRQFRELLLIEWSPPVPTGGIIAAVLQLSDFLSEARKRKQSEAARFLNEIVRGCPPSRRRRNTNRLVAIGHPTSRRNTNGLVAIGHERGERFKAMFSKEFTSLGLVLAGVWSDQTDLQLLATQKFRKVLYDKNRPVKQPFILEYGIVPRFDEFLEREDSPALQTEAALALIDICDIAGLFNELWIDHDLMKYLLKLLDHPSSDIREEAVLHLGEVAETRQGRDLVHQHEAVHPLLDKVLRPLLDELDKNDKLLPKLRNATYTLLRFCKGEERPGEFEEEVAENKYGKLFVFKPVVVVSSHLDKMRTIIPELSRLVHLTDEEVLKNACSMLACFTDGRYCKTQVIIGDDVCRRLVKLLEHEYPSVVSPAMRTLGNIVLREDIQSQRIVEFGARPCLWKLLSKNFEEMVVWETIRSLTKGNNSWIKAAQIKSTNSQFQDSVWREIEGKKKEVLEKLYKYDEDKLLMFCSQLSIPFCRITARKNDVVPKLMDFLEGLGATNAELRAEKEQSSEGKKRRRESEQEKNVPERSAEKMSELSPSDDELCDAVGKIIREVGISTVELTDVMERLGKRFGTDFTPKVMHIRIMFRFQLTEVVSQGLKESYADESESSEYESDDSQI